MSPLTWEEDLIFIMGGLRVRLTPEISNLSYRFDGIVSMSMLFRGFPNSFLERPAKGSLGFITYRIRNPSDIVGRRNPSRKEHRHNERNDRDRITLDKLNCRRRDPPCRKA